MSNNIQGVLIRLNFKLKRGMGIILDVSSVLVHLPDVTVIKKDLQYKTIKRCLNFVIIQHFFIGSCFDGEHNSFSRHILFCFTGLFPPCMTFDLCVCVTIPEVDLSDNNLGDYGARSIAGMLKENSTLMSLNLSGNHFTDQSAEHLGPALITNTKLKHLDISHNALGERTGITAISYT